MYVLFIEMGKERGGKWKVSKKHTTKCQIIRQSSFYHPKKLVRVSESSYFCINKTTKT